MEERQRKKRLNLNEQQWERVRAFVKQFFEEQPEQASKATCQSLFKEIQGQYPCFILSKSAFEKHVGRIEKLKADAGVENFRKYCQRASEKFHEILIGLPPDEFECIQFDGRIQRAHELYPDLHITDRNKKTLANHCPIKQLKARAREQRPGDAPVQTVQTHEPADPAQALGPAAADIDGQRLVECQGQPDYQSAIQRQKSRRRSVFDFSDDSDDDDAGDVDADRAPLRANQDANWLCQLAMPIGLTIWEDILFDHMEQQVKERKKYSKLDEEAWQQVRIFVNDYFLQREEAVKARMDTFDLCDRRFVRATLVNKCVLPSQ